MTRRATIGRSRADCDYRMSAYDRAKKASPALNLSRLQWINSKWLAFDASIMSRRPAAENRDETERCFRPDETDTRLLVMHFGSAGPTFVGPTTIAPDFLLVGLVAFTFH